MSNKIGNHAPIRGQPVNPPQSLATVPEGKSAKRQKLSHHHFHAGSLARPPPQQNQRTSALRRKHVSPRPPRAIRPPAVQTQTSPTRGEDGLSTKTNARSSARLRPPTADSQVAITTLSFANTLLNKIWIRNKNQHRTQPWWKSLSMMRKVLIRLSALEDEELLLRSKAQASSGAISAQDVRKRFEHESDVRRQKEIWTEWTREVLVPKAYLDFSGLVGDTQFANLGVVLIGVLADVMSGVGAPKNGEGGDDGPGSTNTTEARRAHGEVSSKTARSLMATSLQVTGLHSGELVERQYDSDDLGEVIERKPSEEKSKPARINTTDGEAVAAATSVKTATESSVTSDAGRTSAYLRAASGLRETIDEASAEPQSKPVTKVTTERIEREEARPRTRGKKKRKGKNTIDDLFAGLT